MINTVTIATAMHNAWTHINLNVVDKMVVEDRSLKPWTLQIRNVPS